METNHSGIPGTRNCRKIKRALNGCRYHVVNMEDASQGEQRDGSHLAYERGGEWLSYPSPYGNWHLVSTRRGSVAARVETLQK